MAQKYTKQEIESVFEYRINAMLDDGAISLSIADYIHNHATVKTAIIAQLLDMLNSGKLAESIRPLNDQTTWVKAIKKVFRIYRAPTTKGGAHHEILDFE